MRRTPTRFRHAIALWIPAALTTGCGDDRSAQQDDAQADTASIIVDQQRLAEIANALTALNAELVPLEEERRLLLESPYQTEPQAQRLQDDTEARAMSDRLDELNTRKTEIEERIDILSPQRIYQDQFHGSTRTRVNRDISRQINELRRELESLEAERVPLQQRYNAYTARQEARNTHFTTLARCESAIAALKSKRADLIEEQDRLNHASE